MKKILPLLCLLAFPFALLAQKTVYDPNVAVREVPAFHAIEVIAGIELYLSTGEQAVAVSARETEFRDHIKTEVTNGVLRISYDWKDKNFRVGNSKNLKAYVSCKNLESLTASAGCNVHVDGVIQGKKLALRVNAGSDFKGKVDVDQLSIQQHAGSDIDISGRASDLTIEATAGSDLDGFDLISDTCVVSAKGGSDINITVNKELNAEAFGASDISWKGKASVKSSRASGAGSVSHRS